MTDDLYVREHMASGGVLLQDKAIGKTTRKVMGIFAAIFFVLALVAVVLAFATAAGIAAGIGGVGSFLLALMFAFGGLTLSTVRSVVTRDELHIQVGIWGPRIALDAIQSIAVAPPPNFVKVGMRLEGDRVVTSYIVENAEHVAITYTNEDGKERHLRFSVGDPERFVETVNRARGLRIAGPAARIADATSPDDASDEAALTEAALTEAAIAETEAES